MSNAGTAHVIRDAQRDRAVVFVHGYMGSAESSWTDFSRLLADDSALDAWDLLSFGYSSHSSLEAVASQLSVKFSSDWARYRDIAFIAHSVGGPVVQLALIQERELAERVSLAFFFAPPNLGMRTPAVLTLFGVMRVFAASSRQLASVSPDSPFLRDLNERWTATFGKSAPFRYWAIAGVDDTVTLFESLTAVPAEHRLAIPGTYVSIIKPSRADDPAVQIVRSGLLEETPPAEATRAAEPAAAIESKIDQGIVDVFLHCATTDREEVRELSLQVIRQRLRPFLLEDALAGRKWEQVLAERIDSMRSVSICIGKNGSGHIPAQRDKVAGLFSTRGLPVIPTFLETCPPSDSELSETLSQFIPVDFRDFGSDPLQQLVAGITGNKPVLPPTTPTTHQPRRMWRRLTRMVARRPARFALGGAMLAAVLLLSLWSGSRDRSMLQLLNDARKANVTSPRYLKPDAEAQAPSAPHATLLLFIHGIFGDTVGTWTRGTDAQSLPSLILARPEFSVGVDAFAFGYTSAKMAAGSFSITEAVTGLLNEIEFRGFLSKYDRIVIVAHSMGGLVALEALTQDRNLRAHVPLLVTFATPYTGAQVAVIAKDVLNNPALASMMPTDNDFLESLGQRWTRMKKEEGTNTKVLCAYEKVGVPGIGLVVPPGSARALCDDVAVPIADDHIGIVKPDGPEHSSIKVLTNALRSVLPTTTSVPQAERPSPPVPQSDWKEIAQR